MDYMLVLFLICLFIFLLMYYFHKYKLDEAKKKYRKDLEAFRMQAEEIITVDLNNYIIISDDWVEERVIPRSGYTWGMIANHLSGKEIELIRRIDHSRTIVQFQVIIFKKKMVINKTFDKNAETIDILIALRKNAKLYLCQKEFNSDDSNFIPDGIIKTNGKYYTYFLDLSFLEK